MKKKYYVNKNAQATGEHEVHNEDCIFLPKVENRVLLGEHTSCHDAVREAKKHYNNVDGCRECSKPCHTR